jgi:hypothetical protein
MSRGSNEQEPEPETQPEANPQTEPDSWQAVGYGKPPQATRFKPGCSGNPKGRPRGSLNVTTVFTKILCEKVTINENGKRKIVTKLEAALKQLVNKAASGDIRAVRQLWDSARDAEMKQNASVAPNPVIEPVDQEVIDGIVKRFRKGEEAGLELQEANDVGDQCG